METTSDQAPRVIAINRVHGTCLLIIALAVVMASLAAMKEIVLPLFIAVFIFYLARPLGAFFGRRGVPTWLSTIGLLVLVVLAIELVGETLYTNARQFNLQMPLYKERFLSIIDATARWTGAANEQGKFDWEAQSFSQLFNLSEAEVFEFAFGTTMHFVEASFMATFYLIFIVFEAKRLPHRIERAFPGPASAGILRIAENINEGIIGYLVVKTAVSAGLGLTTAAICWVAGVEFWSMWGVLAFLLNYITYVGSMVAVALPSALACIQFDQPTVGIITFIVLTINRFIWIDFIEIHYSGSRLNISPLILLLSLAFWGWIWGVVGMVLAAPIATAMKIVLDNIDGTRWIATLISEE
jgi:AI-2 transport protein TqsA